MRRFDKQKNITKVNLLNEQNYLIKKGLLKEDDSIYSTERRFDKVPVNKYPAMGMDFNTLQVGQKLVFGTYNNHMSEKGKVIKVTDDGIFVKDTYGHTYEFNKDNGVSKHNLTIFIQTLIP